MEMESPPFPYFTWGCATDLEDRFKKTLYHGGKKACMPAVSPAALTDLAVSIYVAAAQSPKRKLTAGYIGSVAKRLSINPCTLMLGLLYCERLRQINPDFLNKISSSDLFVVSLVISSKFLNDEGEDDEIFNDEWAEAGGLAVKTVNRLEREFLDAIQWKVYVGPQEFLLFCNKLETRIAMKHGLSRGWFSYTDLTRILAQMHYLETVKSAVNNGLQVVLGCTLMYGLSLGVILSSALCLSASYTKNSAVNARDSLHPYADRPITRARPTEQVNTCDDTLNARMHKQASNESCAMPNSIPSQQHVHLIAGNANRRGNASVQGMRSSNFGFGNGTDFGNWPTDVRWLENNDNYRFAFENLAATLKSADETDFVAKNLALLANPGENDLADTGIYGSRMPGENRLQLMNCARSERKKALNDRLHGKENSPLQIEKPNNSSLWSRRHIRPVENHWKELASTPYDMPSIAGHLYSVSHGLLIENMAFSLISGVK